MIKNFAYLEESMKNNQSKPTIVLAGTVDEHSLEALKGAKDLWGINYLADNFSAQEAVDLIKEGKGNALMKGGINTGDLLKAVVNKETGIGLGTLMSHIGVFECPAYDRLLFITDGGMVPTPDLEQKSYILKNALHFMHGLGYERPNAALIAAAEAVNPKLTDTTDADTLAKRAMGGEFGACIAEGPISFDLAISAESARLKGFDSQICGKTDLMVVPNMVTGNVLGKSLMYMGGAIMAGCILGAKVPIVLTSRGATTQEKMLSMALALSVK